MFTYSLSTGRRFLRSATVYRVAGFSPLSRCRGSNLEWHFQRPWLANIYFIVRHTQQPSKGLIRVHAQDRTVHRHLMYWFRHTKRNEYNAFGYGQWALQAITITHVHNFIVCYFLYIRSKIQWTGRTRRSYCFVMCALQPYNIDRCSVNTVRPRLCLYTKGKKCLWITIDGWLWCVALCFHMVRNFASFFFSAVEAV